MVDFVKRDGRAMSLLLEANSKRIPGEKALSKKVKKGVKCGKPRRRVFI